MTQLCYSNDGLRDQVILTQGFVSLFRYDRRPLPGPAVKIDVQVTPTGETHLDTIVEVVFVPIAANQPQNGGLVTFKNHRGL